MSYPDTLCCDDCGRHHQLDAVIPSDIWNKIASDASLLCIDCIDKRATKHGVTFEAEFYWTGGAGQSRLYENSYGDQQASTPTPPAPAIASTNDSQASSSAGRLMELAEAWVRAEQIHQATLARYHAYAFFVVLAGVVVAAVVRCAEVG